MKGIGWDLMRKLRGKPWVVFQEGFTGDGSTVEFTLTGTVLNATFLSGTWAVGNVQITKTVSVTKTNGKAIYDSLNVFTRNRITSSSVSSVGVVTLDYAPRNAVDFYIYYWYELPGSTRLSDYYRDDIVSKVESDEPGLASSISADTTNFGGALSGADDTVQKSLDTLDDHGHAQLHIQGTDTALGTQAEALDMGNFQINNLANATELHDAVTLEDVLNSIGVVLSYWIQATSSLGFVYAQNVAYASEEITGTPQTLTTANTFFKSSVADTPAPFTIKNGTLMLVHLQAKVASTAGTKPVTLHTEIYYMDADGTSNQVQIGADSIETDVLTDVKTLYESHIHVATETIVPAGKRLWLKIVATTTGGTNNPTVWIYRGDVHDHISIGVSGILGNFLQLAGGTMSGDIVMGDGVAIGQAAGPLLTFDDTNNYLEVMGCKVGIGTAAPYQKLEVSNNAVLGETDGNTQDLALFWNSDVTKGLRFQVLRTATNVSDNYTAIRMGYTQNENPATDDINHLRTFLELGNDGQGQGNQYIVFGINAEPDTRGTEWMRIDGGKVGIGTNAPTNPFSLVGDGVYSVGTTNADAQQIIEANSNNMRMYLGVDSTSKFAYIQASEPGIDNRCLILQPNGVSSFVGIGTVSPDRTFHVERASALTNTVQQIARLTHITSGTPAAGIGVGLEFEQETAADNNEVIAAIDAVTTDVTSTSEDADLVFNLMVAGSLAEKLRVTSAGVLSLPGGQIAFPATAVPSADANTLDDYEEGTWTFDLQFGGAKVGITYNADYAEGYYTKIGRQVTCTGIVILTSKGSSSGNAQLHGLPFTVANNNRAYSAASLAGFYSLGFANFLSLRADKNSTYLAFYETTEAGVRTNLTNADFADDTTVAITVSYFI